MNSQSHSLKALIAVAEIRSIRLVEVSAASRLPPLTQPVELNANLEIKTSVSERREDGMFFVLAVIDTKLSRTLSSDSPEQSDARGAQPEPFASVHAGFELQYKLPEDFTPDPKDLDEFAKTNGLFNVWPYFREFVQNTSSRMNLPTFVLPLLRLSQEPQRQSEKK
jgi:hypothetical protein